MPTPDGGGHRPEALRWLHRQVDGKLLRGVFSLVEFITWANRALLAAAGRA